jgi:hypothetical protein
MAKPNATIAEAFADGKKNKIYLGTPIGAASYPHILKFDEYQLEENGVYQCNTGLIVSAESQFVAQIDALATEAFEISMAGLQAELDGGTVKGKDLVKLKEAISGLKKFTPYEVDCDEEGEPNGNVIFKTKTLVQGTVKDTGETWKKEVPVFDSSNQKISGEARSSLKLWAGSKIKLSVQVVPFCAKGLFKAGVSLRLCAVQVIELSGGEATAANFGFGVEEDGFAVETFDNAAEGAANPTQPAAADGSSSSAADDDDF